MHANIISRELAKHRQMYVLIIADGVDGTMNNLRCFLTLIILATALACGCNTADTPLKSDTTPESTKEIIVTNLENGFWFYDAHTGQLLKEYPLNLPERSPRTYGFWQQRPYFLSVADDKTILYVLPELVFPYAHNPTP